MSAPETDRVGRAGRVSQVFGRPGQDKERAGPVHAWHRPGYAWCGVHREQVTHLLRPGTVEEVSCQSCLAALRQDRPRVWRSRW